MNASQTCSPLRTQVGSLLAVGFGGRIALAVPANVPCRGERRNAGLAIPSRRSEHHAMTVAPPVSPATGAFGDSSGLRRPDPVRESGKFASKRKTPNQALQRTAGFGGQFRCVGFDPAGSVTGRAPAAKPPAQPAPSPRATLLRCPAPGPPSLSLGSLGVLRPLFRELHQQ